VKKYQHNFQKCEHDGFVRFVGVRVGVKTWVNKLALRLFLKSLYAESQPSTFYSS